MTSKRMLGALLAIFCVGVGVVRWLDLAGNTDAVSGYLISGGVGVRYALLLAPVLLMLIAAFGIAPHAPHQMPTGAAVPAFCGMLFSGIIGLCLYFLHSGSWMELVASLLLLVGSLWFTAYVLKGDDASIIPGVFAVLSWVMIITVLFCTKTASMYHLTAIVELLAGLAMQLLLVTLLRSAYQPQEKGVARKLFFCGMLAFYCGVCLLLPQELWQWSKGIAPGFLQGKSIAAALVGVTGLLAAMGCLREDEDDEEDEDPQAAFARAGRRLQETDPLEEPLDDMSEAAAPARAAAPQRPDANRGRAALEREIYETDADEADDYPPQAAGYDEEDTDGYDAYDGYDDAPPAAPAGPAGRWQSAAATLYGGAPTPPTDGERSARRRRTLPEQPAAYDRQPTADSRTAPVHERQFRAAPDQPAQRRPRQPLADAQPEIAQPFGGRGTAASGQSDGRTRTATGEPGRSRAAAAPGGQDRRETTATPGAQNGSRAAAAPDGQSGRGTAQPQPTPASQDLAAGTLDQLDSLLAQLNDRPASHSSGSADDILAEFDLGRPTAASAADSDSEQDGERWVFRRK